MKKLFGRYVSAPVVDKLLAAGQYPDLQGEEMVVTILMLDIRAFTTTSVVLEAHELVELLNAFFSRACEPILAQDGMIKVIQPPKTVKPQAAQLSADQKVDLLTQPSGILMLESPGLETIRLITSRQPLHLSLLEQPGFTPLGLKLTVSQSNPGQPVNNLPVLADNDWETLQFELTVK